MQNIIGNLNLVTVIAISKAILFEEVTSTQYIGTILLVCGTILNKAMDVSRHSLEKWSSQFGRKVAWKSVAEWHVQ